MEGRTAAVAATATYAAAVAKRVTMADFSTPLALDTSAAAAAAAAVDLSPVCAAAVP